MGDWKPLIDLIDFFIKPGFIDWYGPGDAHAPTLYDYKYGYISGPSGGRTLYPGEQLVIDEYNAKISNYNRDQRDTLNKFLDKLLPLSSPGPGISPTVNTATTDALTWEPPPPPRGGDCPLILDLDGGGISNSGIAPGYPILFDHDGDGLRNATGWVGAGEAIVVRDLNGNGTIDSGRELFGDSTLFTRGSKAGQRAANGFEALADLDSNNDGQFNAADAAFASVKLWKDVNHNGISEAGELFTFAQLGVQGYVVPHVPSWFVGAARRALRQTTVELAC
jgi:hypothetical protein